MSLRVAYLLESTEMSGGVKVALTQAEALARRGHRVAVVSPGPRPSWFRIARATFERAGFGESVELPRADVRIATFWSTVAPALRGATVPVFHLCQGYEADFSFYADRRAEIEEAYRQPTRKLAVSETLARKLERRGHGPATNVGQAFERDGYAPATDPEPSDPPVVIVVGAREADVKGIDVALAGLALWRERGGRFRLRRVSPLPAGAEESASGLVDEYHWRLPPERMPFAYRASDLFIGPSRPEEGFGLPALEALASGLPCLLSDTEGHREFAGDAAWYFADGDPESLAGSIAPLVTEDARRRARRAGPEAAGRFDPADVARRLETAFLSALDGSPRPA